MIRRWLGGWLVVTLVVLFPGCASGPERTNVAAGETLTDQAETALRSGDAEGARRLLESSAARTPEQEVVLGEAYLKLGDRERAQSSFYAARSSGFLDADVEYRALMGLGDISFAKADSFTALSRYEEAMRAAPGMFERDRAIIAQARAQLQAGRTDEARALRQQVLRTDVAGVWELDQALRPASASSSPAPRTSPSGPPLQRSAQPLPDIPMAGSRGALSRRPKGRGLPPPSILDRSAWGASPMRMAGNPEPIGKIEFVTLHHTADRIGNPGPTLQDNAARVKSYQTAHQQSEKWADIGYHFVIDRQGRIWEGRELAYQGAHAGNPEANFHNVGIALIGHFDRMEVTAAQKKSLSALVKWVCAEYGVPASRIYGHDEAIKAHSKGRGTDCPGRNLEAYIPTLKAQVGGTKPAAKGRAGRR